MPQSDEAILALLATNLDIYYELLVAKYINQLCNYLKYKGVGLLDAEDIVIEVFERAYLRLKGYPVQQLQELKLRSWLYKITDNLYINYVTRRKPLASVSLETSEENPLQDIGDDSSVQPDSLLESVEMRKELEDLVRALPNNFREVIYLHFFADLTYQEIAYIFNQKASTVRTNVSRGLRVLRQMLEKQRNERKDGKAMHNMP